MPSMRQLYREPWRFMLPYKCVWWRRPSMRFWWCRAAYVGVNTWDLMDKSRDTSSRPEIQSRLDSMVKAGWSVGRTWGFSLGSGLSNGPLGKVISDPSKILETAPGARAPAHAWLGQYAFYE